MTHGRVLATVTGMRCARIRVPPPAQAALLERRLFHPTWHQAALESNKRRAGAWLVLAEGGFPEDSFADARGRSAAPRRMRSSHHGRSRHRRGRRRWASISLEAVRTAEDWTHLFEEHSPQSLAGVAYITSDASDGDADSAIVRAGHLLELFKQLPANDSGLRAYLVTERAEAVVPGDAVDGFLQASAAGFFRVAHNEYPGLTCSVIDHDGEHGRRQGRRRGAAG